jgi:hypothetical protein
MYYVTFYFLLRTTGIVILLMLLKLYKMIKKWNSKEVENTDNNPESY